MTSSNAISATVVAIAAAVAGVLVAAGLPLSKDLTDHILTLITVATPALIGVIAWLHHSHAKVAAATAANNASSTASVNI